MKTGTRLVPGLFVLSVASLLFIAIAANITTDTPLTALDMRVSQWLHTHDTPALTRAMLIITEIHRPLGISLMAVLVAVYLAWRRHWHALFALLFAVFGGMLLNLLMKSLFARARPLFDDPLLILHTFSFPSGHAMASTVFYGMCVALVFASQHTWRWQLLALCVAMVMVLAVAFSRVYLGVHYPSDVLAAIFQGLAWLALSLVVVGVVQRRSARIRPDKARPFP